MSQLVGMIVRIDDVNKLKELSELWRQPLPRVSLEGLEATRYLDGLEEQVTAVGWALMRQLMVEQWRLTDRALVAAYRERHGEAVVREDGYDELQVVSHFSVVQFPRQGCYNAAAPENAPRKWQERTPAMAAGLTDHRWTLRELLLLKVPLPPWVAPKCRRRPPKQKLQPIMAMAA